MKLKAILFVFILALSTFLAGCSNGTSGDAEAEESNKKDTLTVYTTIFPLENFASLIGGDKVEVKSVYPPNIDAHTYEPTVKTMVDIASADLFIYTGAGIEGFADKAEETLKNEQVKIVKAAEGVELLTGTHDHNHEHIEGEDEHDHEHEHAEGEDEHDHEHEHAEGEDEHDHEHEHAEGEEEHNHDHEHAEGEEEHNHEHEHAEGEEEHSHEHEDGEEHHHHGDYDPHVWLDPIRSIELAENIKNAFIEISPDDKDFFEANFNDLKERLEALDQTFSDTVNQASSKEILVSHAAYGYWVDRYGIEQISISGLSTTQEPSQQQLTNIIELSKEHQIKYLIFDQNVSSKVAEVIRVELGAEPLTLHNLESVSEEDIEANQDYFTLMEKNIETLRTALNGK
ncbi:metal ABC transporter solute-binding protein, Zn/Mn family [Bacillus sp. PS06]|uniref:metal ABC transporter solute-binding protein, Zn/Mn family n=1 Tax=Bacillus sp. PS06 TaxID=2764176 RepID=UPI00177E10F6|nr:zinc ABC transporter substrate-binding protein [Bacillus sp. PS06]MBD8071462.1 zinc ABC transporter substrate-binding protein [Bacillus sp. PS06]